MEEKTFLDSPDIRVTNLLVQTEKRTISTSDIKQVSVVVLWWLHIIWVLLAVVASTVWSGDFDTIAKAANDQLQAQSGLHWLPELRWLGWFARILFLLLAVGSCLFANLYGYNVALHLKSRSRRILLIDSISGITCVTLKRAKFLKTIVSAAVLENLHD